MPTINPDSFVVFDLDDTLYKENDYHTSGMHHVAELVKHTYGVDYDQEMRKWKLDGIKDIFSTLCEKLGVPSSVKDELVWAYRLHTPRITLHGRTKNILGLIEGKSAGIAILTDGRAITQRLKITALGLQDYPFYISAECNSEKPDPARFQMIQKNHPAKYYVYVGDNPKKDFKAPNELGWKTIGLRGNEENIHSQETNGLVEIYHPDVWISNLEELVDFLC
jgi:putative hydrolase of the HAD superfamily